MLDVLKVIRVEAVPEKGGMTCWVHTHGMEKFKQPEFEIRGVQNFFVRAACSILNQICDYLLNGGGIRVKAGERMQLGDAEIFQFKEADSKKEDEKGHYLVPRLEIVAVELKCLDPRHDYREQVKH